MKIHLRSELNGERLKLDRLGIWFAANSLRNRILAMLKAQGVGARYLTSEVTIVDADVLRDFNYKRSLPEGSIRWLAESKSGDSKKVFRIRNVTLNSASGYLFDSRGLLIADFSSWSLPHMLLDRWPNRGSARQIHWSGDVVFLGTQGYYHWLIEDLPAFLQAMDEAPNARVLVRRRSPGYVLDALKIAGIASQDAPISARLETFVFASRSVALQPSPIDVARLRKFKEHVQFTGAQSPRRLYVSRRAAGRTPINESAVESLLLNYGFEILESESVSLAEQIRMFANAEIVVGTHGAGLANVVWCSEGSSHLVEITREHFPKCFAELARVASVSYTGIVDSGLRDWRVDLNQLDLAIRQITGD
jgi:hypothetical protein